MNRSRRLSPEAKVGLFVLLGVMILIYMSLRVGEFRFGKGRGYPLIVYFKSAEGLKKDSGVQIAGVQVGRVEEIGLDQNRAKVAIRIRHDVELKKDCKAVMKTHGVLGEKYIEIIPGSPGAEPLKPGEVIQKGVSAPDIDQLLTYLSGIGEDFQEISASLRKALGGPEREKVLSKTLDNIQESTDELKRLIRSSNEPVRRILANFDHFSSELQSITGETQKVVGSLNRIVMKVEKGEGTLGRLVGDEGLYKQANAAVQEVKAAFSDVKGTLGEVRTVLTEAKGALASVHRMAQRVEKGEGTLGKLVAKDEFYQDLRKGMEELRGTLAEAKKAVGNLQRVSAKIEQGEGSLGKLLTDESLYTQAKKTLRSVDKAAEGLQDQVPISVLGVVAGSVLR